jgi:hypothetical protein
MTKLARVAAVLVTIIGLVAAFSSSSVLAVAMGAAGADFAGGGLITIISFVLSFLFFGSLALLLWLVAGISEKLDQR